MMHQSLLLKELESTLQQYADPALAERQVAYFKSVLPFFGIAKPIVAKIARECAKKYPPKTHQEYNETIIYLITNARQREVWYSALDYALTHKKYIGIESIGTYLDIVRLTQWWDIVDVVADHLIGKALRTSNDREQYLTTLIHDENLWVRRTALLAQLKYKDATNTNLLARIILLTAHEKDFFIRKAIGWALRSYAHTNAAWVQEFVSQHKERLSNLSIKEALKHCRS